MYDSQASSPLAKLQAFSVGHGRSSPLEQPSDAGMAVKIEDDTRALEAADELRVARLRATITPTTYDLAWFYIPEWPTTWTLRRGLLDLQGIDLLAVLSNWTFSGKFPQQTTGARINAVLNVLGRPAAARLIDPGVEVVAAETVTNAQALAYLQLIATSENGVYFVDAQGRDVFHDRNHRLTAPRSTAVQATFGDGGPGTIEIPLVEQPTYTAPSDELWNQVVVTWGTKGETATANDYLSQRKRGVRSLPRETRLATHAAAQAQADALLARYSVPRRRLVGLTVDPVRPLAQQTQQAIFKTVLPLEVSDRVRVIRRPPAGGAPVQIDAYVERPAHAVSGEGNAQSWRFGLAVSPVA